MGFVCAELMLPRCVLCERGKVDQKAEAQCKQEGCILSDRPLCSLCWKSTHSSEGARKHRRLSASSEFLMGHSSRRNQLINSFFLCDAAVCQQCQLERTAYWCAECDLKFCRECFEQIHSVPVTKNHRKLATEGSYIFLLPRGPPCCRQYLYLLCGSLELTHIFHLLYRWQMHPEPA